MDQQTTNKTINLALALSRAQLEIKPPLKNRHVDYKTKSGQHIKYSYADLSDVIAAVTPALCKNELSVTQKKGFHGNVYGLITVLMHSSGETIDSFQPLPDPVKTPPQEFGSDQTYARRYELSGIVGIASEDDDDGAAASNGIDNGQQSADPKQKPNPPPQKPPANAKPSAPTPLPGQPSTKQIGWMFGLSKKHGWSMDQIKRYMDFHFGFTSTKQLNIKQFNQLCSIIESGVENATDNPPPPNEPPAFDDSDIPFPD